MCNIKEIQKQVDYWDAEIKSIRADKEKQKKIIEWEQQYFAKLEKLEHEYIAERSKCSMMVTVLGIKPNHHNHALQIGNSIFSATYSTGREFPNTHPGVITAMAKSS